MSWRLALKDPKRFLTAVQAGRYTGAEASVPRASITRRSIRREKRVDLIMIAVAAVIGATLDEHIDKIPLEVRLVIILGSTRRFSVKIMR